MNFLKELLTSTAVSEGAVKALLHNAIEDALKAVKKELKGLTYDDAINVVLAEVKKKKELAEMGDTALRDAIRGYVTIADIAKYDDNISEDEEQNPEEPQQRLIKSAGNFKLVASEDGEKIFLYDSSGKLLVDMPVVIWKQLQGEI